MREIMNLSSLYNIKSRITIVQVDVGKRNGAGKLVHCATGIGRAKWNKHDEFNPNEGFRVAYERALATIPKENIIEKCGGLKDGDWVRIQSKHSDDKMWGIVINNNILYMIGSDGWDIISDYPEGETEFDYITTIVRPVGFSPITVADIYSDLYKNSDYNKGRCKVYTAD